MKKILDDYYITLVRMYGKSEHYVPAVMAFTFWLNLFSIMQPLVCSFINLMSLSLVILIITIIIFIIICIRYNEKRTKQLKEKSYDDEYSYERKVTIVIVYEILSVAFLIFSIWLTKRLYW